MKDLKVLATILMAGVLFGFAACKTETDSTVAVEKIEITSTVKEVTEGEKITLTATVSPENATNKTVTWSSSDEKVATVDENGVVTGVKAGNVTITAKAGEQSATVDITVNAKVIDVTGVEITSTVTSVIVGEKITLEAKVNPDNATNKNVTWSSSDEKVATVDEKGVVTGVKAGITTITAKVGEKSATMEITVKAPLVSSIELSKTRFANTEGGSEFTATVSGSNFDLISKIGDKILYVQILDSDGNVTAEKEATVDATNNKATASLTLPTLTSATTDGTSYTVRAKVCGNVDTEHTATFSIFAVEVTDISLTTSQIPAASVTDGMTTKATVSGSNFDLAGTITLALYKSTGDQYGDSVTVDSTKITQGTTSFDVELPIPTEADTYTVKVLFADVAQSKTASLLVSMFSSFKIPNAGISKKGNTVTATVIGKNFTAGNITSDSFSLTCTSNSDIVKNSEITISNDRRLTITLTIPENAGSYDVTIASGNDSLNSTFTVKDYSSYAVGDVILKDGSKVDVTSVESTTFETSGDKVPVAVVAGFNVNGATLGLGLKKSAALSWAESGTTGYKTSFIDIITNCSGSLKEGFFFTGDCDGSDNWNVICSEDPEGTDTADEIAENYPAFDFAVNYGTNQSYTGDLASGWYIPSISELKTAYDNRSTIQTSLGKVSDFTIVMNNGDYYFSSSQWNNDKICACVVNSYTGSVADCLKYFPSYVLVVRAF